MGSSVQNKMWATPKGPHMNATKCPMVGDPRVLEALRVALEMRPFMVAVSQVGCPKAKEVLGRWDALAQSCPHLHPRPKECTNPKCGCNPCKCRDCCCEDRMESE